jgi:negative regulator of flagellin synthesis FlgM
MPPFEVGLPRAIGAVTADIARKANTTTSANASAAPSAASASPAAPAIADATSPSVATSVAANAGQAPVDTDRVAQIRKAVETGNYPLVPARIADAMIAAGMFLRSSNA